MRSVVDFHSHILPAVDDGSAGVEESVAMLRQEREQGITDVVATPHFYPHRDNPGRFLERRARAWEQLSRNLEGESFPRVHLGAEIYYFSGISESEILADLRIQGTDCVLIELPFGPWTSSVYRELEAIRDRWGLQPVVAHVDRYIAPFRTRGIPERLEELPVLVQANANFFLRRSTASMAMRMLHRGQIHLLGSDCHNMDSRQPNLGPALACIEKKLGAAAVEELCRRSSQLLTP